MCRLIEYGYRGAQSLNITDIRFALWSFNLVGYLNQRRLRLPRPENLQKGVMFRSWALKRVLIFNLISLSYGEGLITLAAHTYPKLTGVPPPGVETLARFIS